VTKKLYLFGQRALPNKLDAFCNERFFVSVPRENEFRRLLCIAFQSEGVTISSPKDRRVIFSIRPKFADESVTLRVVVALAKVTQTTSVNDSARQHKNRFPGWLIIGHQGNAVDSRLHALRLEQPPGKESKFARYVDSVCPGIDAANPKRKDRPPNNIIQRA
jgi:hypothetical protein